MSNLIDYYKDLLHWEGEEPHELVHQWPQELRDATEKAFVDAVSTASLKGSVCPLKPNSTNQSIGNQVEKYTLGKLGSVISGFSIFPCQGQGYPDKMLIPQTTEFRIPLEVKATSSWNESNSIRRVLTSSSKKLRAQFREPIHHLVLTTLYSRNEDSAIIEAIRLDFLEPTTTVNVRLEASVSHKILANGPHHSKTI